MKIALLAVVCLALLSLAVAQAPTPVVDKGLNFADVKTKPGTCLYTASSTVRKCEAGTYENGWGQACILHPGASTYTCQKRAPAGTWTPEGSDKTFPCPAGTIQSKNGASCRQCDYGTVGPTAGAEKCVLCEDGFYQDQPGQTKCKKCPQSSKSVANRGECVWSTGKSATARVAASFLEMEEELSAEAEFDFEGQDVEFLEAEAEVDAEAETEVEAESEMELEAEDEMEAPANPAPVIEPGKSFGGKNVADMRQRMEQALEEEY